MDWRRLSRPIGRAGIIGDPIFRLRSIDLHGRLMWLARPVGWLPGWLAGGSLGLAGPPVWPVSAASLPRVAATATIMAARFVSSLAWPAGR